MVKINDAAPDFNLEAYYEGDFKKIGLADYKGKWVILFFYPADFTFVCPTELGDLANSYQAFKAEGAEIMAASTDSKFSHKAWHDTSKTINKITFPMLADPTAKLARDYGVYIEESGEALRGTFIIDPDGVVKSYEINAKPIGRSSSELMRKLQAAKFVREHNGEVCPMNWKPGEATLTEGVDLVGKI